VAARDELAAEVRELMRRWWSEPGEPPTADELVAYLEGELGPVERSRIEAALARHPEAADALAALRSFPDVEPPPGYRPPSKAELDEQWRQFRGRLGWDEEPSSEPRPALAGVPHPQAAAAARAWPLRVAAAIAFLGIGAVLGWIVGRVAPGGGGAPSASVAVVQLAPVGAPTRGLAPGGDELAEADRLLLFLASAEAPRAGDHRVTIAAANGGAVWRTAEARPDATGTLRVDLPGDFLAPGTYRILVEPLETGRPTEYELTIPTR